VKKTDSDLADDSIEVAKLKDYSEAQRNIHATGGQEAADSDEEEESRG